jgi:hypothetical protein
LGESHVQEEPRRNPVQDEAKEIRVLSLIPYKERAHDKVKGPKRLNEAEYDDQATLEGRNFVLERF